MGRYTTSIDVEAPQDRVWQLVNDLHRNPDWVGNVQAVLWVSNSPVGVGTVFRERLRVLGPFHAEGDWRITRFEPSSLHEHQGSVPVMGHTTVSYLLEPAGNGCRCSVEISYEFGARGLSRAVDTLIVRPMLARAYRRNLKRLKQLVGKKEKAG